ncbi:MAG: DUF58 domain-containing protein [Elusimicrobia bacterium]|nr:DUF58 domain-containing protein [Elusimicrobiota bacterium]
MIAKEILSQVRRIEIRTGRLVTETFAGQYLSVFKGRGMEFSEVREYSPGDDVRTIDWNVTARTGRPHVRRYQEERELTAVLACDLSGSQFFGTGSKLKQEVAAEIGAVLAFAAMQNNDKVGLFLFTEEPELYIPPKKGRRHVLSLIRDLLAFRPAKRGTAIGPCLDTLTRLLKRRSIVFVLSDFQDEGYEKSLRRASRKHDLVPILVEDRREAELPALSAWLELEDPETSERLLVHAGSARVRDSVASRRRRRREALEAALGASGLSAIRIRTDEPYVDPIVRFFRERAKRFR